MINNEKLYKNIGLDNDVAKKIYEKIKKVNDIQREIAKLNQFKLEENKKYMEAIKQIDFLIEKQKEKCSHELTTYHEDPAGGFDSFTMCDICGKEIE